MRPARAAARHRAGFWLVAGTFLAAMAFSTAPAPLYPLYQAADGFSTFTVTIVFAAYAVGVALALVLAGHVSDWLGRRRVLLPALALELVAAALFLSGTGLATLLVARFVSGLGVGMLTATATAHLQELHAAHRPDDTGHRPQVVAVVANIGGLGLGALVAGALAETGVAPLRLPYLVFVVLLVLGVAAVLVAPETVRRPAERPAYRPQRPRRAGSDPAAQRLAYAAAFASFAVFGVFTSVAPGFVGGTLHHASRLLAGLVVFVVFGAAAAVQAATTRVRPAGRLRAGVAAGGGRPRRPHHRDAHGPAGRVPARRRRHRRGRRAAVRRGLRHHRRGRRAAGAGRGAGRAVPRRLPRPERAGAGPRAARPGAAAGDGDGAAGGGTARAARDPGAAARRPRR